MTKSLNNSFLKKTIAVLFAFCIMISSFSVYADKKEKEKFDSWQAVAFRMAEVFDEAIASVEKDDLKAAYERMNKAYFGYYETQGFEATVMNSISKARVSHIEAYFRDIKHTLLGNKEGTNQEIINKMENLKVKVYRDAMVLDGVAAKDSDDSVGEIIYGDNKPANKMAKNQEKNLDTTKKIDKKSIIKKVSQEEKNHTTFITTYTLLLREGLEAILVIVAIITYLVKTGNKKMCKSVYFGIFIGVVCSIILAFVIDHFVTNSGVARELIEGWTMFFAVAILFYVSNWMLSKSSAEKWDNYIQEKVHSSVDKKSQYTLVFASFLAVFREGAELILFYTASFAGGQNNPSYIIYGLLLGTLTLLVIYALFRFTTVKLPLKPFFLFTSILLYLMCISFMGKGVIELTEANVITGSTVIEPIKNLEFDLLNIYPRAETLIPQIMLLIASVWILIKNLSFTNKKDKNTES